MNKSLFFAVFAAVLILGCTSASGPAGPGLTIREFSFSPTSLTGAQKTSLSLVVQNTGSMDVKDAYAKIFGFGKESGLWNILPQGEKKVSVKPFGLRAQASFAGNVGEQKKFVWLLQNKDKIPEDMTRTYTANARLCYPYNTTALGRVELMSENEWMSKNSPQHEILVSQTSAPVRITVLSKQPIISSGQLSLDLLIENTGGGTVAMPGYCEKVFAGGGDVTRTPLNKLNLVVSGLTNKECTTSVGTSNNIFLEKGKSVKVSADCGIGSESAPISAADLKIEMGYDYYVDAKANVMVKGTKETATATSGGTTVVTPPGPTPPTGPTIVQLTGTGNFGVTGLSNNQGCSSDTVAVVGALKTGTNYNFRLTNQGDTVTISQVDLNGNAIGTPVSWHVNEGIWLVKNDAQGVAVNYAKANNVCTTRVCNGPLANCNI